MDQAEARSASGNTQEVGLLVPVSGEKRSNSVAEFTMYTRLHVVNCVKLVHKVSNSRQLFSDTCKRRYASCRVSNLQTHRLRQ